MNQQQLEAIPQIAAAAVRAEKQSGVPAELTAAQCALESGWLQRCEGNNAFGIKWKPRHKDSQLILTTEYVGGKPVKDFRRFARFASLEDAFADHGWLISEGTPYAEAWARYQRDRNLDSLVAGVAARYATDPAYAAKITAVMRMPELAAAIAAARAQLGGAA